MKKSIEKIAALLHADTIIRKSENICRILTDSRNFSVAEETLFFALKTESNDAHKYIGELYQKGVRHFVVSEKLTASFPDANLLLVPDTLKALQILAADVRNDFSGDLLAITGSNGKTVVKEWLWQLLREDLNISRSPGSYNSQIGVPLSLSEMEAESDLAIIEAGISKPEEMKTLAAMIRPKWGILTHIGPSHQENFVSLEEKIKEKLHLFDSCRRILYCADEALSASLVRQTFPAGKCLAWSALDDRAPLYFRVENDKEQIRIHALWHGKEEIFPFPYNDDASIQNVLQCLAFLSLWEKETDFRIEASVLKMRLWQLEPVAMRMEMKDGKNDCVLINDTYNSDLQALSLALDFQQRRPMAQTMRRCLILSDIYQSGEPAAVLYAKVADWVRQRAISRFIGVGKDLVAHASLFPLHSQFFLTTESLLVSGLLDTLQNELILIKGSRKFGFERVTAQLSKKAHATVMEVDLKALVHNMNYFRSLLRPRTKLIAMVKAEAYGHGALEVAKTLQAHACDAVAVAVADEGVALRRGGIRIPILVMNPEIESMPLCYEYRLEPEIYSFAMLEAFLASGEYSGVKDYPVHIKLDTGMHRLGFTEADLPALTERLRSQSHLRVRSVFTHLAGSDENKFDDYTHRQWQLFDSMSKQLQRALPYRIMRHILNSAGIERFPEWQCDMVRLGIGLYGVSVEHPEAVEPVASLKTKILQIHHFKAGETIGYSRTTLLERDSDIATLPIGYADGLNRHNRGETVLLHDKRAPIVGNICMDACMIDVTGIPAREGDSVTIFGMGLPLTEVAERLDTISYEVLTSVSARVKRVYFQD